MAVSVIIPDVVASVPREEGHIVGIESTVPCTDTRNHDRHRRGLWAECLEAAFRAGNFTVIPFSFPDVLPFQVSLMADPASEQVPTESLSYDSSSSDMESIGLDNASLEGDLGVSVIWAISGDPLGILRVPSCGLVWDLKLAIEKCLMPGGVTATRISLMLGLQLLADADRLDDAGIVEGSVLSISTGPPYKIIVCRDAIAEIWDGCGRHELSFLGHGSEIRSAEFSRDNAFVVTSSLDCTSKLWQTASPECILTFKGHRVAVMSAVFSTSATEVLTASLDGTARLWGACSGRCVRTFHHGRGLVVAAVSPCGSLVLTMSGYNITIWNLQTGMRIGDVPGPPDCCKRHANFSPRGGQLYVCAHPRNVVHLWAATPTGPTYHCLAGHSGEIRNVAFSRDGCHMVTASTDKTARVWSMENVGKVVCVFRHDFVVDSAAISPDGMQVLTVSQHAAWLWDLHGRSPIHCFQHAFLGDFTPDCKAVLTLGSRGIAVWSAGCGRVCWRVRAQVGAAVAFSH